MSNIKKKHGSQLDDLSKLHEYSKKIVFSAISEDRFNRENTRYSDRIEPYEPSMFVYSFFVYNALYNIDWEKSEKVSFDELYNQHGTQGILRESFLSYISNCSNASDWFRQSFRKGVEKYCKRKQIDYHASQSLEQWVYDILNGIVEKADFPEGYNVKEEKTEVLDFFKNVMPSQNSFDVETAFKCFDKLIYKVRNNLFHGSKDFAFFEQNGQCERFAIYSIILSAMCDVLFKKVGTILNE